MKIKKFICMLLVLASITTLCVGCEQKNELTGKWSNSEGIWAKFNDDNTFYFNGPDELASGTYEKSEDIITFICEDDIIEFYYKIDDDILILENVIEKYHEEYALHKEK